MFTGVSLLVMLSCHLISSSATVASTSGPLKDDRSASASLDFKALLNEQENENTCIGPGSKYRRIRFFRNTHTWYDAKSACELSGGHLAIIRSVQDERAVNDIIRHENIDQAWMGFHSRPQWVSVLGERLNSFCYVHWHDNEPHESDACVSYMNLGLRNHRCNDNLSYFCEYRGWSKSPSV